MKLWFRFSKVVSRKSFEQLLAEDEEVTKHLPF